MRKKNLIIFLLFITVLTACGVKLLGVECIQIESLNEDSTKIYLSNDNSFSAIKRAVKNSEESDSVIKKYECSHKIILEHYVGKNEYYYIYVDARENSIYFVNDDSDVFKADMKDAIELFSTDAFTDIYVRDVAPSMSLVRKGKELPVSKEYQWMYKKADDNIYERTLSVNQENKMLYINDLDSYEVKFSELPDSFLVKVFYDNKIIKTAKSLKEAFKDIEEEGKYYVEINAVWNRTLARENYGTQTINFVADIDYPAQLELKKTVLSQGDVLSMTIKNINEGDNVNIRCTAFTEDLNWHRQGNDLFCLIPIGINTPVGEYEIRCIINEGLKNEVVASEAFSVNDRAFEVQHLEISEETIQNTQSDQATQEYVDVVKSARSYSHDEILWKDKFILPLQEYTITTEFGQTRYVNDDSVPTIHSGIDMAAATGTEIRASNTGIVRVSRFLTMTGNTVVIDHGMGLFTTYYHLDSLRLMENSIVEKGNIIGTVGNTGFSTGPHLHFCISIYNDYINTYQPIEEFL